MTDATESTIVPNSNDNDNDNDDSVAEESVQNGLNLDNERQVMGQVIDESLEGEQDQEQVEAEVEENEAGQVGVNGGGSGSLKQARLFFAALCTMFLFQFAYVSGYTPSILTALETRYGLSSTQVAIILSCYDIGGLIAAIPISYIGGSRTGHRPVWIGIAGLSMAFASLLWVIANFIGNPYRPEIGLHSESNPSSPAANTKLNYTLAYCSSVTRFNETDYCETDDQVASDAFYAQVSLGLFIAAHTLSGAMAMAPMALGPSYMQDGFPSSSFAVYLGALYATTAVGPVLGFGLGAICQTIFVDFVFPKSSAISNVLSTSSPRWVGAWWLGYAILTVFLACSSIPFFFFPRTLQKPKSEKVDTRSPNSTVDSAAELVGDDNDDDEDNDMVLPSLNEAPRELLRDTWALLKNPIWILNNIVFIAVSSPVNGFVAYLKKYMESMFGYPAPTAALLMGGILVPAAALGVGLGGLLNKKLGLKFSLITARHLGFAALAGCALVVMMLVRCPSNAVVGIHNDYDYVPSGSLFLHSSSNMKITEKPQIKGLDNVCNANCSCDPALYEPICGSNGLTYFSGCYAGCPAPSHDSSTNKTFENCNCIVTTGNKSATEFGWANPGSCASCLTSAALFLAITFIATLSMALGHNGAMFMLLRSIPRSKRALSLGLHNVLFKIFAAVPAPLLFGSAVDSACIFESLNKCSQHRQETSGLGTSNNFCLLYDANRLSTAMFGLAFGYCGIAAVFLVVLFAYLMKGKWQKLRLKLCPTTSVKQPNIPKHQAAASSSS